MHNEIGTWSLISEIGNIAIPPPAQKTFDAEGEALEHALTRFFRLRNDAIKSRWRSRKRGLSQSESRDRCSASEPERSAKRERSGEINFVRPGAVR
jgi:hypothetical protein